MRKSVLALSAAAALAAPGARRRAPSPRRSPATWRSCREYRFRGIDQTFGKPALQGGFDYAHSSGVYLGNWNSNVESGAGFAGANLEMDFYGGWKKTLRRFRRSTSG